FEHEFNSALEIADGNVLVHVQALDLVESGDVGSVCVVAAIHPARDDDSHRRLLLLHDADLDGRSMGAEQRGLWSGRCRVSSVSAAVFRPLNVEGVLRIAGGMISGRIEGVETVVFVLDLGAIRNDETDLAETSHDV